MDTARYVKEDEILGIPNRFAVVRDAEVNIIEKGIRTEIVGKGFIRRYQVNAPGALSMGLYFSKYRLPEGARLFIYSPDRQHILGAFTSANNHESDNLAIALLEGESAIIEYFEPYQVSFSGVLVLGSVSQSYKPLSSVLSVATENRVGINCPEGSSWQDQKRSVCRMIYHEGLNGYYCTGFLVNNINQDGTPYFMTANHCISSNVVASTLVTYFNYEHSSCYMSTPSAVQTISGATLKASSNEADFSLLLLREIPPSNYYAYLAGWDASNITPLKGTCIHHPSGEAKSISIDKDPPLNYSGRIQWDNGIITEGNTHWIVKFDIGNTEGGSSGSPLFDDQHRVIGQLHGGGDSESYFGKLSISWNSKAIASGQLKAWLDPQNTGKTKIDGTYLNTKPKAAFSTAYPEACVNEVITLVDQSKYTPKTWQWKFEPSTYEFVNGSGSNSPSPRVIFKQGGIYSAELIVSNDYGKDTILKKDFIQVINNIQVSLSGIPANQTYCGYNLSKNPIRVKGAHTYSYFLGNTDKLTYQVKSDSLILDVVENAKSSGTFTTRLKVKGFMGTCTDTDSVDLTVAMPPNDNIANAIRLWPGNNSSFSNFCGCGEAKEPVPPLTSCVSNSGWCSDASDSEINNSIWFTFVGPSSGKVTIDTHPIDSRIAVYKAEKYQDIMGGSNSNYTLLAANDNRTTADVSARIDNLSVEPGKVYWLQVDGAKGATGNISVSLLGNSLEIFPNPSDGRFDLIISAMGDGKASLYVYNQSGKQVLNRNVEVTHDKNRFSFDMSSFSAGMYYVKVRMNDSEMSGKVMIVKD